MTEFDGIVSELGRRKIVVLRNRPTRWGYVIDAVIPSAKVVILKMPGLGSHVKVAMSMFQDLITRLEGDGYRVMVVPKNSMNDAQIKNFCDRISSESSISASK